MILRKVSSAGKPPRPAAAVPFTQPFMLNGCRCALYSTKSGSHVAYLPPPFMVGDRLLILKYHDVLFKLLTPWSLGCFRAENSEGRFIFLRLPPTAKPRYDSYGGLGVWAPKPVIDELMKLLDERLLFVSFSILRTERGESKKVNYFQILDDIFSEKVVCPFCRAEFTVEHTRLAGAPPLSPESCPGCQADMFYDIELGEVVDDFFDGENVQEKSDGKNYLFNVGDKTLGAYAFGGESYMFFIPRSGI